MKSSLSVAFTLGIKAQVGGLTISEIYRSPLPRAGGQSRGGEREMLPHRPTINGNAYSHSSRCGSLRNTRKAQNKSKKWAETYQAAGFCLFDGGYYLL